MILFNDAYEQELDEYFSGWGPAQRVINRGIRAWIAEQEAKRKHEHHDE